MSPALLIPRKARLSALLALVCLLALPCASAQDELFVVSTVRPLALIAKAVLGDQAQARAIITAQDSPHHFSLSPGDRLALASADLLVWVGPEFEVFLQQFFSRQQDTPRLTVLELPDLVRHKLSDDSVDPHVWLDPDNALVIAAAIAARVSELDPANEPGYSANLARFTDRVNAQKVRLDAELGSVRDLRYAVYHNAYQYFEKRFGLSHGLALVANPEVAPGMRQTLAVRSQLAALAPACVLLEPDYNPDLLTTLLDGRDIKQVPVDPLGYDLPASEQGYVALLDSIAAAFAACVN